MSSASLKGSPGYETIKHMHNQTNEIYISSKLVPCRYFPYPISKVRGKGKGYTAISASEGS